MYSYMDIYMYKLTYARKYRQIYIYICIYRYVYMYVYTQKHAWYLARGSGVAVSALLSIIGSFLRMKLQASMRHVGAKVAM